MIEFNKIGKGSIIEFILFDNPQLSDKALTVKDVEDNFIIFDNDMYINFEDYEKFGVFQIAVISNATNDRLHVHNSVESILEGDTVFISSKTLPFWDRSAYVGVGQSTDDDEMNTTLFYEAQGDPSSQLVIVMARDPNLGEYVIEAVESVLTYDNLIIENIVYNGHKQD